MGTDKALLPWESRPLVVHTAELVTSIVGSATLVGAPERYRALGLNAIPDLRLDRGPLAGIEAALASDYAGDINLVVACDIPGLDSDLLESLAERARKRIVPCVAARDVSGQVHPLCAVYRKECLSVIRDSLDWGRLRLTDLLDLLDADYVDSQNPLANINTPQQWAQWPTR
jgi:molybdopterin-guanine dinucleotide biosynthesis protein A